KWLFAVQKYTSEVSIAILHKRNPAGSSVGSWQAATINGLRFDESAGRAWASCKPGRKVPSLDTGPRIIRFLNWTPDSRFLTVTLLGPKRQPARVRFDTRAGRFM